MYMPDSNETEYPSEEVELLVSHGSLKIYGKPDCVFVLRHPTGGSYARRRFFGCEKEALAAGYRPCAICMEKHHRLWKAGKLMTHALHIGPGLSFNELWTVYLANGEHRTLTREAVKQLDEFNAYSRDWNFYDMAKFKFQDDYCIITLLGEAGYWGRVIVWDYVQNHILHLTAAPFAQCSTVFKGQVVSLYEVYHWYEAIYIELSDEGPSQELDIPNGSLWYSAVPLGVIDPEYEPDLYLLPLPVPDCEDDEPDCFDIRVEGDTLIFQAGTAEYRLDSL